MKTKKIILTQIGRGIPKKGDYYSHISNTITPPIFYNRDGTFKFKESYMIYTSEVLDEHWKPDEGESYIYICFDEKAIIRKSKFTKYAPQDIDNISLGNCYRDNPEGELEATEKLKQIKEIFKS